MSKKRRVFDIDLPDDLSSDPPAAPGSATAASVARRGPMASAVRENAESLSNRADMEARIRAENDRLAHEHVRLKKAGLITDLIPTEAISTTKLIRDRNFDGTDDLSELKASIEAIGLSNPIQVEQVGEGAYELVQGLRRLSAWRELRIASGGSDERWTRIPATIIASGEALEQLYRRMVDENLVRKDISFGEMAVLARDYAADQQTKVDDVDAAVLELYRSAGKQKRSYIRAFAQLFEIIGAHIQFPQAIPRQLGLDLRKAFEVQPDLAEQVLADLAALPAPRQPEDEKRVLSGYAQAAGNTERSKGPGAKPRPARTTFRIERPGGSAKVTASHGRLEVRLNTDFSAKDRRMLEAALEAFLAQLDE
ncbi:ParB/RepB/Spo0J family partition protein [Tropicimonas isoalkanivorans]|uniref:Chromosome partitioning protein, ParB family n=1 Tax=Tropicimonas isoalkanivorans TaxID=441112 RepID=A0A1I1Q5G8_9RHOB|nr:ParB N-terminal domain-containing protein [Tropicimonas isoalkanivorans]SFD17265.1 chromosome partitioning protein, ParB family [Tropicimonas isoalkanivorans]